MATITRSDVDSRRQWQAFFDEHLRDIGERAPQPTADQSTAQYLRAVCRTLKYGHLPEGHELRGIPFDKNLPNDALYQLVPQVVEATKKAVNDPATVPYGEFRAIEKSTHAPATQKPASLAATISRKSWAARAGGCFRSPPIAAATTP